MPSKKLSCKTGLERRVINKNIFDREIGLCQKLSRKNKGECGWGKCKNCGVLFLLHKFYKRELIEGKEEIKKTRKDVLGIIEKQSGK